MHNRVYKLDKIVSALNKTGFQARQKGTHGIFFHPETGLIVTLPLSKKDVPPVYLNAILKQIEYRGLMTEERFLEMLD
jgi:predicted RNA binding protein YcfA (HicA-like mRNA interferase family)